MNIIFIIFYTESSNSSVQFTLTTQLSSAEPPFECSVVPVWLGTIMLDSVALHGEQKITNYIPGHEGNSEVTHNPRVYRDHSAWKKQARCLL